MRNLDVIILFFLKLVDRILWIDVCEISSKFSALLVNNKEVYDFFFFLS